MKAETIVLNEKRNVTLTAYLQETGGEFGFEKRPAKEIMGELTRNGFTEPDMNVSKNGDNAPVLAVNCSLKHMRRQEDAVQEILKPMYDRMQGIAQQRGFSMEVLMDAVGNSCIRELMEMVQMDAEDILEIDKKLHGIVNKLD